MLFPGCECGIVPIVRRLIGKGVPPYAGIAFMLTGPIINPVVLFATYVAFGSNMHGMVSFYCSDYRSHYRWNYIILYV